MQFFLLTFVTYFTHYLYVNTQKIGEDADTSTKAGHTLIRKRTESETPTATSEQQENNQPNSDETITLHYFPFIGRRMLIELLAIVGNISIERQLYSMEDWMSKIKPSISTAQLPILSFNTPAPDLTQTNAIVTYFAMRAKKLPDSAAAFLRTTEYMEISNDIFNTITITLREQDPFTPEKEKLVKDKILALMRHIEVVAKSHSSSMYFFQPSPGKQPTPTLIDYKIYTDAFFLYFFSRARFISIEDYKKVAPTFFRIAKLMEQDPDVIKYNEVFAKVPFMPPMFEQMLDKFK